MNILWLRVFFSCACAWENGLFPKGSQPSSDVAEETGFESIQLQRLPAVTMATTVYVCVYKSEALQKGKSRWDSGPHRGEASSIVSVDTAGEVVGVVDGMLMEEFLPACSCFLMKYVMKTS